MRRILLVLTVALVMTAMLALNAGYAFAQAGEHNPNFGTTPAAASNGGPGGACVVTFRAPPAEGGTAPGSTASGGAPLSVLNGTHGNNC